VGLNLNEKKAVVAEVSAQVADAQTIAIAEYRGIAVSHMTVLRRKARESGVYLRVLKNTLVRRAVADTPFAGLSDQMVGPLIYSISGDPVAAAKVLNDFAKTNDSLCSRLASSPATCSTRLGCRRLPPSRAAKSCLPGCSASCRLRCPVLPAAWLRWPSNAKKLPLDPYRLRFELGVF
jgi:large subunit ribosomal protein L10